MHQSGLLERARRNSRRPFSKNPCSILETKKGNQNNAEKLTQVEVSGAFVIFGIGLGFAVTALAGEMILKKIDINRRPNQ